MSAQPFLKWVGGKRALLPALLPLVPREIETYHEPMVGGGALFFALAAERRFKRAILSDANAELIRTYRAIRDLPDAVLDALLGHKHTESHYYAVRDVDPKTLADAECAARMLFLNRTCFNGLYRLNRAGRFNVAFGDYEPMTSFADPENIRACSRVLQGVTLEVRDFNDAVSGAEPGDFFYFDPPYVPVSRTSNFTGYVAGGFDLQDQSNLSFIAAALAKRGVAVIVSNSDCAWVRRAYPESEFAIRKISRSGQVNCSTEKRGRVGELIITSKVPDLGTTAQGESTFPNARGVDGAAAIPRSENDATEARTETGAVLPGRTCEVVTSPGEQRALFGGDV